MKRFLIVFLPLVTLIGFYALVVYNSLVPLNNNIKEAYSNINVYSQKRSNLINNLVDVANIYTNYEEGTLKDIAKLRSGTYPSSNEVSKIMAIYENYPELKANETFKELTGQLGNTEDEIAKSIRKYNDAVKKFNNKVEAFPRSAFAHLLGFKAKPMFNASEFEKCNIKIDFNRNK